jgi:hypothetical protein
MDIIGDSGDASPVIPPFLTAHDAGLTLVLAILSSLNFLSDIRERKSTEPPAHAMSGRDSGIQ